MDSITGPPSPLPNSRHVTCLCIGKNFLRLKDLWIMMRKFPWVWPSNLPSKRRGTHTFQRTYELTSFGSAANFLGTLSRRCSLPGIWTPVQGSVAVLMRMISRGMTPKYMLLPGTTHAVPIVLLWAIAYLSWWHFCPTTCSRAANGFLWVVLKPGGQHC
jgi:hypothetical protein